MENIKGYLLMALAISSSFFVSSQYYPYTGSDLDFKNSSYEWLQEPPADADTTKMICMGIFWTPYTKSAGRFIHGCYDFERVVEEIPVATSGDNVYLKILNLVEGHDKKEGTRAWIKGVKEGDKLRFKDHSVVGYANYDLLKSRIVMISELEGILVWDTIPNQRDTLYLTSVSIGKKDEKNVKFSEDEGYDIARWPINYTNEDIIADYNPTTGLINHLNFNMLVRPVPLPEYNPESSDTERQISNWDMRDEMAIMDFVIGPAPKEDPVSLPTPEMTYRKLHETQMGHGGTSWEDYWIEYRIDFDPITPSGEFLDPSKLKVVMYFDGIPDEPYPSTVLNFFKKYPEVCTHYYFNHGYDFTVSDWNEMWNDIEVMVYYENEDGTRTESPRVKARNPAGIENRPADPASTAGHTPDDRIYDLTGRVVNPYNLSPGLYIQNGRKFIIR